MKKSIAIALIVMAARSFCAAQDLPNVPRQGALVASTRSCPIITVVGPPGVTSPSDPYEFAAKLSKPTTSKLRFVWIVSSGEILEGQGTPKITVYHVRDIGSLTATVRVLGFPEECADTASASVAPLDPPEPVLFDEFSLGVSRLDKPRFEHAIVDLKKRPSDQLYIIEYFDTATSKFAIREKIRRLSDFFRGEMKLAEADFEIVTATALEPLTKIYFIPPGANHPIP